MVYKFESTKRALSALPEDARCMLLLGGHIVNELNTLHHFLIFTMRSWPDPIEDTYAGAQYWTVTRLWIGKVAEGLEVFQKRILGKPFGRTYLPLVERYAAGKDSISRLRQMTGASGLLRRLRNTHTFHNPSDDHLEAAFQALDDAENWSMMAASTRHSVLFPMSHVVAIKALIDETEISDVRQAVITIRDELLGATDALISFFEHLTIAMADHHELFFGKPVAVKDTRNLPNAEEVKIPPLCKDLP